MRPCCVKRRNERVGPAAAGWCRARHRDEPAYDSYVAVVARVVRKDGAVRVEKLTCVADCGIAVSPAGVDEQLYGGLMGLGHATSDRIDFRHGRVQQSNFDTYRVMRMSDMPDTDIHIVQGDPAKPGGVGELSARR